MLLLFPTVFDVSVLLAAMLLLPSVVLDELCKPKLRRSLFLVHGFFLRESFILLLQWLLEWVL
jgi:hypothetical protein